MAGGQSGGGGGSHTHANRDRSDLKGSPRRPAEQTGERGSGRSDSTAPSDRRDAPEKQTG